MGYRLLPILGLGVAVAGIHLNAANPEDTELFRKYHALEPTIQAAQQAVESRHFDTAHRLLATCLERLPEHFEAHFLLARMAYEAQDYAGALDQMLASERALADLNLRYGRSLSQIQAQDQIEEDAFQTSLDQLGSKSVDGPGCSAYLFTTKREALANLEAKKGHLYDSRKRFAVPVGYRLLHGNCLYRLGRRTEAVAQYRLAVEADPQDVSARNNLIALLMETGDTEDARQEVARAESAGIALRPALKKAVLAAPASSPVMPR